MLGEELRALCAGAEQTVMLVAPFMKMAMVAQLLEAVEERVQVTCITRWHPEEIAAGVSDIGVWTLIRDHPRRTMLLRQDLHAKYYRADSECLVGSANLTARALGFAPYPNLELLVPLPAADPRLISFEQQVLAACVQVDDDLAALTQRAVESLPVSVETEVGCEPDDVSQPSASLVTWTPRTRQPEDLYVAYAGAPDALPRSTREAASQDLALLSMPPGLTEEQFNRMVGVALLRLPLFRDIDDFVALERRFGEVTAHIESKVTADDPVQRTWQTMFRWLMHFLPDRYTYSRPRHTEVIVRRPGAAVTWMSHDHG